MKSLLHLSLLGCASIVVNALFAAPASAQFIGGGFAVPGFTTPFGNSFQLNYYQRTRNNVNNGFQPNLSVAYAAYGPIGYGIVNRYSNLWVPAPFQGNSSYSGYMTGSVRPNDTTSRDFARAQQQAALARTNPVVARNAIYDQWAYEKLGVVGLPAIKPGDAAPAALIKALAGASEADIASGESLNHIVVGIVAAEKKGKADSAFLPPNLLAPIRFSGPPAADAINLLRQVGSLKFPAAFDDDAFAELRPVLEKDIAAAAAPVLLGKAVEQAKVLKLEADVKKARAVFDPKTRNFEFEDAFAARRFLNQLDTVVEVLKGGGSSGLIDPRWTTEGTSVADLVKHLVKNKLLFGPAPSGEENAYIALHRGLAAYLYALNESQKAPPKK